MPLRPLFKHDVPYAYSSNGDAFYEHDFLTGQEQQIALDKFPTQDELVARYYAEQLKRETPERVLHVLADIVRVYMYKAGLAKETVERTARMVAEGGLENMFSVFAENFAEEKRIERQEGRQEGAKEQSIKIAKKMFRRGRSAREVQEMTELPNDTVLELKREYEKNRDVPER